jgi:hypothetical protein
VASPIIRHGGRNAFTGTRTSGPTQPSVILVALQLRLSELPG